MRLTDIYRGRKPKKQNVNQQKTPVDLPQVIVSTPNQSQILSLKDANERSEDADNGFDSDVIPSTPPSKPSCSNHRLFTLKEDSTSEDESPNISRIQSPVPLHTVELSPISYYPLDEYDLPIPVLEYYASKGIDRMFRWQYECLHQPGVLEGSNNLVFSAPTSAGKTIVSDILLIRSVLLRKCKALLVLPFISLANEKVLALQTMLRRSGVRVGGFMGNSLPNGHFPAVHIAVCTIEKANNIVNQLLELHQLHTLGTVVVDELHLLGDPSRGHLLETLLTKLRFANWQQTKDVQPHFVQIVGMSATLANLEQVAGWLNAAKYCSTFRPVPLLELIKEKDSLIEVRSKQHVRDLNGSLSIKVNNDPTLCLSLALETVLDGNGVLVFCPTKDSTEKLALQLANTISQLGTYKGTEERYDRAKKRLITLLDGEKLKQLLIQLSRTPAKLDRILASSVAFGVAFHHAGLSMDERDLIEYGFRQGILKVLFATPTLSSGVNLPARRVIIRGLKVGISALTSMTYKQMIGRAGRQGVDDRGESVLICEPCEQEAAWILCSSPLQPITSQLALLNIDENVYEMNEYLFRACLEVVGNGLVDRAEILTRYLNSTFLAYYNKKFSQQDCENILTKLSSVQISTKNVFSDFAITNAFQESKEKLLLVAIKSPTGETHFAPSSLGAGVFSSSLQPAEALQLFSELRQAMNGLVLHCDLHLLYYSIPAGDVSKRRVNWRRFAQLFTSLEGDETLKLVAKRLGVSGAFVQRAATSHVADSGQVGGLREKHIKFYYALALNQLIDERPLSEVCSRFELNRGDLQQLQQRCSGYAGMMSIFCRKLGWHNLAMLVKLFQDRLFFGVAAELVDLMNITCLNGRMARALFAAGLAEVRNVAHAGIFEVEKALRCASQPKNGADLSSQKSQISSDSLNWVSVRCRSMTEPEIAKLIVNEARALVEQSAGVSIDWDNQELKGGEALEVSNLKDGPSVSFFGDSTLRSPTTARHCSQKVVPVQLLSLPDEAQDVNEEAQITVASFLQSPVSSTAKSNSSSMKPEYFMPSLSPLSALAVPIGKRVFGKHLSPSFSNEDINDNKLENSTNSITLLSNPAGFQPSESSWFATNKTPNSIIEKHATKNTGCFTPSGFIDSPKKSDCGSQLISDQGIHSLVIDESPAKKQKCVSDRPTCRSNLFEIFQQKKPSTSRNEADFGETFVKNPLLDGSSQRIQDSDLSLEETCIISDSSKDLSSPLQVQELAFTPHSMKRDRSAQIFETGSLSENEEDECKDITTDELLVPQDTPAAGLSPRSNSPNATFVSVDLPVDWGHKLMHDHAQAVSIKISKDQFQVLFREVTERNVHSFINSWRSSTTFALYVKFMQLGKDESIDCTKLNSVHVMCIQFDQSETVYMLRDHGVFILLRNRMHEFDFVESRPLCITFDSKRVFKILSNVLHMPSAVIRRIIIQDAKLATWLLWPELDEPTQPLPLLTKWLNTLQPNGSIIAIKLQKASLLNGDANRIRVYLCYCTALLTPLCDWLLSRLGRRKLYRLYRKVELPVLQLFGKMETIGVRINRSYLEKSRDYWTQLMDTLQGSLVKKAGGVAINPASPKQVRGLLFGEQQALCKQNVESNIAGCVSTSRPVLEKLRNTSEVAGLIVDWRRLQQLLEPASHLLNMNTERVCGEYQHWISTGRVAMHTPNLLAITKNFTLTMNNQEHVISLRKAFIADSGWKLISADFCQLELRVLACLSKEKRLLQPLNAGEDIFKTISASILGVTYENVTADQRTQAKEICYSLLYGIGDTKLAEKLKLNDEDTQAFRNKFNRSFPALMAFLEQCKQRCADRGYVQTMLGRLRPLPEINSNVLAVKASAERKAINSTIQGSAADLVKVAMLRVQNAIQKKRLNARILLQIHDELLFEVKDEPKMIKMFVNELNREMPGVASSLIVKLPIKIKIGENWSDLKDIDFSLLSS